MQLPLKRNAKVYWWFSLFIIFLIGYSFFSYSLTDPNLVLTSWQPYWVFQNWMWQEVFSNKPLLTNLFTFLTAGLFISYAGILFELFKNPQAIQRKHIYAYVLVLGALFLSYNALSHDVFNYIFNAKIVAVYHENPHAATALQYSSDLWTRFMHNTHTAAPYGYGWTAFSLIPYLLGFNKFIITWFMFRVVEIIAVVLLYKSLQYLSQVLYKRPLSLADAALLFLNPLFLLEMVSNMHNDVWMMVPGIYMVAIFLRRSTMSWQVGLALSGLLLLSISVKYVTILLVAPLGLLWIQDIVFNNFLEKHMNKLPFSSAMIRRVFSIERHILSMYVPLLCSIVLFVPLFTSRSQLFHPWYLVWSLCWLPVIKQRWWRVIEVIFSLSSLLRYLPWLREGGFASDTLYWQQLITWGVAAVGIFAWVVLSNLWAQKNNFKPV